MWHWRRMVLAMAPVIGNTFAFAGMVAENWANEL
jgi:hypothetical protein